MQITELSEGARTVVVMEGRLDTSTALDAEARLLARLEGGAVIADMEGVRYVSSAGLRVLLRAAKTAKSRGTAFAICALQPAVREVFEISGFDRIIPSHATRAEALAAG